MTLDCDRSGDAEPRVVVKSVRKNGQAGTAKFQATYAAKDFVAPIDVKQKGDYLIGIDDSLVLQDFGGDYQEMLSRLRGFIGGDKESITLHFARCEAIVKDQVLLQPSKAPARSISRNFMQGAHKH